MRFAVALIVMCGLARADRISVQPVDARIIAKNPSGPGLVITLALPDARVEPDTTWRAYFLKDGQPIVRGVMKLVRVSKRTAVVRTNWSTMPSDTVRLYPPWQHPPEPPEHFALDWLHDALLRIGNPDRM